MVTSHASAEWKGGFRDGKGTMKPKHGGETTFSAPTRFEGQEGGNPEELIGAALAGCYSMALTVALERAGGQPTGVRTTAEVQLDKKTEGWTVTSIALDTTATVPGMDPAKFQEVAEATKKGCPVSRALGGSVNITLSAKLG